MRSQSLREEHLSSTGSTLSRFDSGVGPSSSSSDFDAGYPDTGSVSGGAGVTTGNVPGIGSGAADLVRRHHTLSTSSSRLVRLERSRARLALQGVGLSEEDQEYYVPPSPVRATAAGWSDVGHDSINSFTSAPVRHSINVSTSTSGTGTPASVPVPATLGTGHGIRAPPGTVGWGNDEAASEGNVAAAFEATAASVATPAPTAVPPPNPKRSSFVVLRGAKGDSELTQRKTDAQLAATLSEQEQIDQPLAIHDAQSVPGGGASTELRHKNSLKPFLDAEAAAVGGEEEWEKSLKDERDREEMDLYNNSRGSTMLSSSFPTTSESIPFSHSRANTFEQPPSSTSNPWSDVIDGSSGGAGVRRHQSLNSNTYRPSRTEHDPMPATSPDTWAAHARLTSSSEELLSSLSLSAQANSFTRSRAGTSPAPLNLQSSAHRHSPNSIAYGTPSLVHSSSLNAGSGTRSHASGHTSTGLTHSASLDRGTLSPAFPRSPWSPTLEETKQLNISSAIGTPTGALGGLSRGESTSSRGSRLDEEVNRLGEEINRLEVGSGSGASASYPLNQPPKTPPGFETVPEGPISPRQQSNVGRSQSGSAAYHHHQQQQQSRGRLPPLMTNMDAMQMQQQAIDGAMYQPRQGPASAAAFVPPIGHTHLQGVTSTSGAYSGPDAYMPLALDNGPQTARGIATAVPGQASSDWLRQKESLIGGAPVAHAGFPPVGLNPASYAGAGADAWPAGGGYGVGIAIQQQQQIQVLQSQMQQALTAMDIMRNQGAQIPPQFSALGATATAATNVPGLPVHQGAGGPAGTLPNGYRPPLPGLLPAPMIGQMLPRQPQSQQSVDEVSPVDVSALVASKGYNPANFDLRPANARFFVIKSYTEEDVHKSLKYEIWASTDLGNKRLDRAFRESADKGPIYLFFSVNASGHFAGMAQMLTPVDYQTSSNVWASDKWKGVLKVRWIYIKDVPLASLRHIRLSNTPENKPVTSSRDTQEVPYDAGLEVLRILATYQSRTSLLQDFAWYEARTKADGQQEETRPPHYSSTNHNQSQPPSHYPPRTSSASPFNQAPAPTRSPVPGPNNQSQYGPGGGMNGSMSQSGHPSPQQQPTAGKNGGGRRFFGGAGGQRPKAGGQGQ